MVKFVCILGLGWISWNIGVLGAMFRAFGESDFESECDSESECESCSGDTKVSALSSLQVVSLLVAKSEMIFRFLQEHHRLHFPWVRC